MNRAKQQRLERAGWVVGNAKGFLGLTREEERFIELKLALASGVRRLRERRGLTQAQLARRLGSSQSRVAKIEAADSSVSVDLMVRSLLGIGVSRVEIARIIGKPQRVRAA
jgi:ribosome-binding protein aMBF1 (putative translation factor)